MVRFALETQGTRTLPLRPRGAAGVLARAGVPPLLCAIGVGATGLDLPFAHGSDGGHRLRLFRRKESGIRVSVAARTHVGTTRSHNEDRYLAADLTRMDKAFGLSERRFELGPRGAFFLVADGMGGAAAGEIASQMAVDLIYEQFATNWGADPDPCPENFALHARRAIERANARLHEESWRQEGLRGMGTTATMAGLLGERILLSQVGDSRAYRIRDGGATQLTRDQSFVQHLVDTGRVTEEEAHDMSSQNVIMQALGPNERVEVVQHWEASLRDDILLLCSDGLTGQVRPEEMAETVEGARNLPAACGELIELANERGGPDNITVLLAHLGGDGLPTAEEAAARPDDGRP